MSESTTIERLQAEGWRLRELEGYIENSGPLWCRKVGDDWRYGMLVDERHLNRAGVAHGGMLMTLFDHASSSIAWESASRRICVTVQISVHLHLAVKASCFVEAYAGVVRRTRDLIFIDGGLTVGGAKVLTGHTIHKVIGN